MGQISRIIILFLFTVNLFAGERPSWINSPPKATAKLHYFVGLSTAAESEEAAIRLARANATERSILELFGGNFSIENRVEQTTKSVEANFKVEESIKDVQLKNISNVKTYAEKSNEAYNGFVLISVPENEVRKELKRIRKKEQDSNVTNEIKKEGEFKNYSTTDATKIYKGMLMSEVKLILGEPTVIKGNSGEDSIMWAYKEKRVCDYHELSYLCFVWFYRGQVSTFKDVKMNYVDSTRTEPQIKAKIDARIKIRKGMKKSQVIKMLGPPKSSSNKYTFEYDYNSVFCSDSPVNRTLKSDCQLYFENGRVDRWNDFKAEYTTDLDD